MEAQEQMELTKEEKIKKLAEILGVAEDEAKEIYERWSGDGDK